MSDTPPQLREAGKEHAEIRAELTPEQTAIVNRAKQMLETHGSEKIMRQKTAMYTKILQDARETNSHAIVGGRLPESYQEEEDEKLFTYVGFNQQGQRYFRLCCVDQEKGFVNFAKEATNNNILYPNFSSAASPIASESAISFTGIETRLAIIQVRQMQMQKALDWTYEDHSNLGEEYKRLEEQQHKEKARTCLDVALQDLEDFMNEHPVKTIMGSVRSVFQGISTSLLRE